MDWDKLRVFQAAADAGSFSVRSRLIDSREKPHGELRGTTTLGLGDNWLAPRPGEFVEPYPEIKLQLLFSDDDLDLAMREADAALWLREPS
jgi:DNA-binding transcriptional LysR family regulator